jgi:hypothetical protein
MSRSHHRASGTRQCGVPSKCSLATPCSTGPAGDYASKPVVIAPVGSGRSPCSGQSPILLVEVDLAPLQRSAQLDMGSINPDREPRFAVRAECRACEIQGADGVPPPRSMSSKASRGWWRSGRAPAECSSIPHHSQCRCYRCVSAGAWARASRSRSRSGSLQFPSPPGERFHPS